MPLFSCDAARQVVGPERNDAADAATAAQFHMLRTRAMAVLAGELAGLGLADAAHQGLRERFGMAGVTGRADLLADEMRFNRRAGRPCLGGRSARGRFRRRRAACREGSPSAHRRRYRLRRVSSAAHAKPAAWRRRAGRIQRARKRPLRPAWRAVTFWPDVFRRLRFGSDRLGKAGERGKRIIVALSRRGLCIGAVEIEQCGINALARCREDAWIGGFDPDRQGGLNQPQHRSTDQRRLQKREKRGQRPRITCPCILRCPVEASVKSAQPAHQNAPAFNCRQPFIVHYFVSLRCRPQILLKSHTPD